MRGVTAPSKTLSFPDYMFISENYYKSGWSLSGAKRRLKNVIVLMEYMPDPAHVRVGAVSDSVSLTDSQRDQLKRVFDLFDVNSSGGLNAPELVQLLRANGVNVDSTRDALVREIMSTVPSSSDGLTSAKALETEMSSNR